MPWQWDAKLGRYRDSKGLFLANKKVLSMSRKSITTGSGATDVLAQLWGSGALNADDWYSLMREEIKGEYIRQYLLGIGGVSQMNAQRWGQVGGMIADQYRYLENFRDEIAAGNLTEAQIAARSQMYMRSASEGFERARARVADDHGYDQERWVLDGGEHCEDCVAFAGEGWKPFGYFPFPGAGKTKCLTNCLCAKQYRKARTIVLPILQVRDGRLVRSNLAMGALND